MEAVTTIELLEQRIKAILPERYQDCYEEVQPVSMGSAGLKYGADGKVAWNEIWGSFCDLAMAGGPPHKGTLLLPATLAEVESHPAEYAEITAEICRGIQLVTTLKASPSQQPGWIEVTCSNPAEAGWLTRAIVMENVSARAEDANLFLPAGPHYRIAKEVKNVITSTAKTFHYWDQHTWPAQQREIAALFEKQGALLHPPAQSNPNIPEALQRATGLTPTQHTYPGWLGLECPDVHAAIWLMRALVASAILARREQTVLFVPSHETVIEPLADIHAFAKSRSII